MPPPSLHLIRDAGRDKPFDLEMGWLCAETEFKHALVPSALVAAADQHARATLAGGGEETKALAAMEI